MLRYGFMIVNKKNSVRIQSSVHCHDFGGGYVGYMLNIAQSEARKRGGKLQKSINGNLIEMDECANGDISESNKRIVAKFKVSQ